MKTLLNIPVVLTVAALSLTVGCTKKREAKLADGAGRYMDAVSTYKNKSFPLDTLGPKTDAQGQDVKLGQSLDRKTDVKAYGIQDMPMVNFKTEAKVPEGTRLYARPNTRGRYWIEYQLTNEYLVLHKVSALEDIPLDEKTLAEPSETHKGLVRVPIIGYPISSKVVREVAKNDLGEKTSRLDDRSVPNIEQAQYVQVDFTKPTEFTKQDKKDVLPVDYLKGEWYFSQTIIGAPDDLAGAVAYGTALFNMGGFERYYSAPGQTKVIFSRGEKGIEILGTIVPEEAKGKIQNLPRLGFLPATPVAYRVKTLGASKDFKEDEDKDVPWQETKYVKVDWHSMESGGLLAQIMLEEGPKANFAGGAKLVYIQLEDNFLALTYDMPGSNFRVQSTFWRASEHAKISTGYSPRIHFESDWNKFGYFTINKPVTPADYKLRSQEDFDKIRMLTRYNPKMGKITYYLSESTPDWGVASARAAVQSWNEAFRKAGTQLTIELNETERKSAGDIRYNVINFIGSQSSSGSGSLGIALTITEPTTGEIISSKVNVWQDNYYKIFTESVDRYMRGKAGTAPDIYAKSAGLAVSFMQDTKAIKQSLTKEDAKMELKDLAAKIFSAVPQKLTPKTNNLPFITEKVREHLDFRKRTQKNKEMFDQEAASSFNLEHNLARYCPFITSEIEKFKSSKSAEVRVAAAEKCGLELTKVFIIPVIVHEMGHSFGLRHNFRGSNDKANWLSPEENGTPYPSYSSSVMEYPGTDNEVMMKPGYYDIAAIRFGYADMVGLENNTKLGYPVKIDVNKSIEENMADISKSDKGYQLRNYMFCTDEHTDERRDPLCNRFDAGSNAGEIVNYYIKSMNDSFTLNTFKGDAARLYGDYLSIARFQRYVEPMMKIYGAWRNHLATYMKNKTIYLQNMDSKTYQSEILEKMKVDKSRAADGRTYAEVYAEFKPAADRIYGFLKGIAMLPDRYCVTKGANGKLDILELSKVRSDIYQQSLVSINSCKSKEAAAYFANKKASVVAEFGYHVQGLRYDMDPKKVTLPYDVFPTFLDRLLATLFIANRGMYTYEGYEKNFFPNLMDEPQYREDWMALMIQRAVDGISAASLDSVPELKGQLGSEKLSASKKFFSLFKSEQDIFGTGVSFMKNGLWIPGEIKSSLDRMKVIGGRLAATQSFGKEQDAVKRVAGGMSFDDEGAIYSRAVIMKYSEIEVLKSVDLKKFAPIIAALKEAKLPTSGSEVADYKAGSIIGASPAIMKAFSEVAEASEQEVQEILQEFVMIYGEDMAKPVLIAAQMSQTLQKIDQMMEKADDKQKEEIKKQVEEIMGSPITKIVKDFKPILLDESVKLAAEKQAEIVNNTEETDAHQDLLLKILLLNYVETGY